jgi:hypothetical protein
MERMDGEDLMELAQTKPYFYIETYLETTDSWSRVLGRCYKEGGATYSRKDKQPLNVYDITAVRKLDSGQSETYRLSEDHMSIKRHYKIDSGD